MTDAQDNLNVRLGSLAHQLPALAAWAQENRTGVAHHWTGKVRHVGDIEQTIVDGYYRMIAGASALSDPLALAWTTVAAGAPDRDGYIEVVSAVASDRMRARWAAVGPLGPLCAAAGMDVEQSLALVQSGVTDRDGLMTLAGLQGWKFPPPALDRPT